MAALSSNQAAYMTCRSGAGRSGAFRSGFMPRHTQAQLPGGANPSQVANTNNGPFCIWKRLYVENQGTVWTPITTG